MNTVPVPCHTRDEWVDAATAAQLLGVTINHASHLATAGRLETRQVGRTRFTSRASIAAYVVDPKTIQRRGAVRRQELTEVTFFPRSANGRERGPRLPLRDLQEVLSDAAGHEVGASEIALRLGVSRAAASRARWEGLTEMTADRWAVAAGYHPSEVWVDWWAVMADLIESGDSLQAVSV